MSLRKRKAIIYKPSRTVTQSGFGQETWVLKFCSNEPKYVEPLMGWIGSRDTDTQLLLKFSSQGKAESYAKTHGIEYSVLMPQQPQIKPKSYSDSLK